MYIVNWPLDLLLLPDRNFFFVLLSLLFLLLLYLCIYLSIYLCVSLFFTGYFCVHFPSSLSFTLLFFSFCSLWRLIFQFHNNTVLKSDNFFTSRFVIFTGYRTLYTGFLLVSINQWFCWDIRLLIYIQENTISRI